MPFWGAPREGRRRILELAAIAALVTGSLLYYTRYRSDNYKWRRPGMPKTYTIEEVRGLLADAHPLPTDGESASIQTNGLARFTNPPHLLYSLPDPPLIPASQPPPSSSPRLIIIGDVHGQLGCLRALLAEVGYDAARRDRVVLAGDMINKGADSAGVVALAMEQGFAGVRGNHEDKVLRIFALAEAVRAAAGSDAAAADWEEATLSKSDRAALATARSLTPVQRDWIAARPLLLRLDAADIVLGSSDGNNEGRERPRGSDEVVVVHAGVVPGVPLQDQDPWALMSMRTLLYPSKKGRLHSEDRAVFEVAVRTKLKDLHPTAAPPSDAEVEAEERRLLERYTSRSPSNGDTDADDDDEPMITEDKIPIAVPVDTREGRSWAKAWNEIQRGQPAGSGRTTVVYGHDARKGLNIKDYTFGLDSGCIKGGRLTALVFEPDEAAETGVGRRLVSVPCQAADGQGSDKEGKSGKKDKGKKEKK